MPGFKSAGGIVVQVVDDVAPDGPAIALVGDGGAGEAVRDDGDSPFQAGPNLVGHQLGPGRGEQQQLGFRRQRLLALQVLPQVQDRGG